MHTPCTYHLPTPCPVARTPRPPARRAVCRDMPSLYILPCPGAGTLARRLVHYCSPPTHRANHLLIPHTFPRACIALLLPSHAASSPTLLHVPAQSCTLVRENRVIFFCLGCVFATIPLFTCLPAPFHVARMSGLCDPIMPLSTSLGGYGRASPSPTLLTFSRPGYALRFDAPLSTERRSSWFGFGQSRSAPVTSPPADIRDILHQFSMNHAAHVQALQAETEATHATLLKRSATCERRRPD